MKLAATTATVVIDGNEQVVPVEQVHKGDTFVVNQERIFLLMVRL